MATEDIDDDVDGGIAKRRGSSARRRNKEEEKKQYEGKAVDLDHVLREDSKLGRVRTERGKLRHKSKRGWHERSLPSVK